MGRPQGLASEFCGGRGAAPGQDTHVGVRLQQLGHRLRRTRRQQSIRHHRLRLEDGAAGVGEWEEGGSGGSQKMSLDNSFEHNNAYLDIGR